jgi:hypothetical protein
MDNCLRAFQEEAECRIAEFQVHKVEKLFHFWPHLPSECRLRVEGIPAKEMVLCIRGSLFSEEKREEWPSSTDGTGYNDKKILLFCFSCSFGSTGAWIRKDAELARGLQRVTG